MSQVSWRDIGTIYPDVQGYEVLHACPACGAVVCGGDIPIHEEWHERLTKLVLKGEK